MRISDRRLFLYSAIASYIALILLLFSIYFSQSTPCLQLSHITYRNLGWRICTVGEIENIHHYQNTVFFTIKDSAYKLRCVMFHKIPKTVLRRGKIVQVVGKLEKYKGSLQMIVESVE